MKTSMNGLETQFAHHTMLHCYWFTCLETMVKTTTRVIALHLLLCSLSWFSILIALVSPKHYALGVRACCLGFAVVTVHEGTANLSLYRLARVVSCRQPIAVNLHACFAIPSAEYSLSPWYR